MTKQFLAIDGGGTKTDVVWFDETGRIINRVIGKSANLNGSSWETVSSHLEELFESLFQVEETPNIETVFGGFAGGSHPKVQNTLKTILARLVPSHESEIEIQGDAINALWSGTHGKPGLVLIAGTGSIVFGRTESGKQVRVGGWGYLIGDEGSGYDIGRMAAMALMKAYDGRGPSTQLTPLILNHLNLEREEDFIPVVYENGKAQLAQLVPLVARAAKEGDSCALAILDQAGERLAELISAGLSFFDSPLEKIGFVGGLQYLGNHLTDPLQKHLSTHSIKMKLVVPEADPVYGAAIECLRMDGLDPPIKLFESLKTSK